MRKVVPAILWSAVILLLCLMPKSNLPDDGWFNRIPYFDKLVHAVLFAIFYLALRWASPNRWLMNLAVCVLYGGLVELLQEAMHNGRSAEWTDLLADGIGATFAALLAFTVRQRASG
jgi:VanZ family protein